MIPFSSVRTLTRTGSRDGRCNTVDVRSRTVAKGEEAFRCGASSASAYRDAIKPGNTEEDNMAGEIPKDFRRVVSSAWGGNGIEWYEFYIFGSVAAHLGVKVFESS